MNPELQKQISDILSSGKDFVSSQAPETIQQYLSFEYYSHIGWGGCWAVILLFIVWANLVWIEDEVGHAITSLFGVGAFIGVCCGFVSAWQITHFPKGYLLQSIMPGGCH